MADDKPKKVGSAGKKIGGVKRGGAADQIRKSEAIVGAGQVKKTSGVGAVTGTGAGGKRRPTRLMTLKEREKYFDMVKEEADKLFANSDLSDEQREVIEEAVKMAVDASLVDDEEEEKK